MLPKSVTHSSNLFTTDPDFSMQLSSWVQPELCNGEFCGLMDRMARRDYGIIMMQNIFDEHRCQGSVLRMKKLRLGRYY